MEEEQDPEDDIKPILNNLTMSYWTPTYSTINTDINDFFYGYSSNNIITSNMCIPKRYITGES